MKKSLKVLFTVLSITSFLGGCTINYNYNYYTKSEENSKDECISIPMHHQMNFQATTT